MLEGETLNEEYSNFDMVTGLNCCLYGCVKGIIKKSQPRVGFVIEKSGNLSTHEYLVNAGKIIEYKN